MEIVKQSSESAQLILSHDELMLLKNSLNELGNGIDMDDEELSIRMGFRRERVLSLLEEFWNLLQEMKKSKSP